MTFKVSKSNRKSLSVTVTKKGEILVHAPFHVSDEEINNFVFRHRRWINNRLKERENTPPLTLENGALLTLFGNKYQIATGEPAITSNVIFLPEKGREGALRALLIPFAEATILPRAKSFAAAHKFPCKSLAISLSRSRWGVCTASGDVRFSFRLAFLSEELIEYIIVHELCHTRCFRAKHGPRFWKEVEKYLPDWRALRKRLTSFCGVMDYL